MKVFNKVLDSFKVKPGQGETLHLLCKDPLLGSFKVHLFQNKGNVTSIFALLSLNGPGVAAAQSTLGRGRALRPESTPGVATIRGHSAELTGFTGATVRSSRGSWGPQRETHGCENHLVSCLCGGYKNQHV